MNRSQYIREIDSRLSGLSIDEVEEALSFYEEILDDRGISIDDQVPSDMPSPRKAAYEILRDINISNLETETQIQEKTKNKTSLFKTIALSILAAPLALPLWFALIALIFALALAFGVVYLSLTFAGFATMGVSLYEIFVSLPGNFQVSRLLFLIGAILLSISVVIFIFIAAKYITNSIKNFIINRRKRESIAWKH